MKATVALALCVIALCTSTRPAQAVTLLQLDTFQDTTTQGWFVPGPSLTPPSVEANGGPAGPGDAFLRLEAGGGGGPGSRLSVLNSSQWSGDYLAAGVTVVRMDVNNFGPEEAHLRLLFEDFDGAGPPVNLALSAAAVVVPANSGWMAVQFPITPADLLAETFGTVEGALSSTDTLRIFHNPDATFPGPGVGIPAVNLTLGLDNVCATSPDAGACVVPPPSGVPAPGAGWLVGAAVSGWAVRARRRRRSSLQSAVHPSPS